MTIKLIIIDLLETAVLRLLLLSAAEGCTLCLERDKDVRAHPSDRLVPFVQAWWPNTVFQGGNSMSTQQLKQQSMQVPAIIHQQSVPTVVAPSEETGLCDIQCVLRLLWTGQAMTRQTTRVAEQLCKEVTNITQKKAQLILRGRAGDQLAESASVRAQKKALFSFAVQFGDVTYGTLYIALDNERPPFPAIPFAVAQLLAQVCGWLLYTFGQSVLLESQCQHLSRPIFVSITRREQEVLTLMCLGYNQQSIAEKLHISPATVGKHRQHIYEQLDVHNERDALLAAYRFGLFSILDLPSM